MTQMVPRLRELEKLGAAGILTDANTKLTVALQEYQRVQEFIKTRPEFAAVRTENLIPA
jgi:hypothetical protein